MTIPCVLCWEDGHVCALPLWPMLGKCNDDWTVAPLFPYPEPQSTPKEGSDE